MPGVVTNITRFGAFVDIGVKQDGLVHVSEISHTFITDPNEVLKLNDKVMVKITEIDIPRKRIALSIKQTQEAPSKGNRPRTIINQNKPAPKPVANENIVDALALLKKKFGK